MDPSAVYHLTMPGHLGAQTAWTHGPTTLELTIRGAEMMIAQDGRQLAAATVTGPLANRLRSLSGFKPVRWGDGIYGKFGGPAIKGTVLR